MRTRIILVLAALIMLATAGPATAQFKFSREYHGVSVTCVTKALKTMTFGPENASKGRGYTSVDVVDLSGAQHRYVFAATIRSTAPRNLGVARTSFEIAPWNFVCTVQSVQAAAYTCSSLKRPSGTCTVCYKRNRCKLVSFNVRRARLSQR